tara:strand:- start:339 stop:446 length:108 start_codon:yes stop_codon:yes gene_type:complete
MCEGDDVYFSGNKETLEINIKPPFLRGVFLFDFVV